MSLASYKTVLGSVMSHEQSAAESSTVMFQRRRSSFVRILPDYIVGPPNLRVLLTVNHVNLVQHQRRVVVSLHLMSSVQASCAARVNYRGLITEWAYAYQLYFVGIYVWVVS